MTATAEILDAPDGSRWRMRCGCGAHPSKGHDATPVSPATNDRSVDIQVAEDRLRLYGTPIPAKLSP